LVEKENTHGFCSVCKITLTDVYFKCLNCISVELCCNCELQVTHPTTHLLVKLRQPVHTLPLKQQLIFKDHIENPEDKLLAKEQKQELRAQARAAIKVERLQKKAERQMQRLGEKKRAKAEQKIAEKRAKALKKRENETKDVIKEEEEETVQEVELKELVANTTEDKDQVLENENVNLSLLIEEFQVLVKPSEEPVVCAIEQEMATFERLATEQQPKEEELIVKSEPQELKIEEEQPTKVQSTEEQPHQFKEKLNTLAEMGFTDRERNIRLLVKNKGSLDDTVEQLLFSSGWFPSILSSIPSFGGL